LEPNQKTFQVTFFFDDKARGPEMLKEQAGQQAAYGTAASPVIEER
jgi:hypothetical protein